MGHPVVPRIVPKYSSVKRAFQGDSSGIIAKNQMTKEAKLFLMKANYLGSIIIDNEILQHFRIHQISSNLNGRKSAALHSIKR